MSRRRPQEVSPTTWADECPFDPPCEPWLVGGDCPPDHVCWEACARSWVDYARRCREFTTETTDPEVFHAYLGGLLWARGLVGCSVDHVPLPEDPTWLRLAPVVSPTPPDPKTSAALEWYGPRRFGFALTRMVGKTALTMFGFLKTARERRYEEFTLSPREEPPPADHSDLRETEWAALYWHSCAFGFDGPVTAHVYKTAHKLQSWFESELVGRKPAGGRPRLYETIEDFMQACLDAAARLARHGDDLTQEHLAEHLGIDARQLRHNLHRFGLNWLDLKADLFC